MNSKMQNITLKSGEKKVGSNLDDYLWSIAILAVDLLKCRVFLNKIFYEKAKLIRVNQKKKKISKIRFKMGNVKKGKKRRLTMKSQVLCLLKLIEYLMANSMYIDII